jgi:hypothetical protein
VLNWNRLDGGKENWLKLQSSDKEARAEGNFPTERALPWSQSTVGQPYLSSGRSFLQHTPDHGGAQAWGSTDLRNILRRSPGRLHSSSCQRTWTLVVTRHTWPAWCFQDEAWEPQWAEFLEVGLWPPSSAVPRAEACPLGSQRFPRQGFQREEVRRLKLKLQGGISWACNDQGGSESWTKAACVRKEIAHYSEFIFRGNCGVLKGRWDWS